MRDFSPIRKYCRLRARVFFPGGVLSVECLFFVMVWFCLHSCGFLSISVDFCLCARLSSEERVVSVPARFLFHGCLLGQCARACLPLVFSLHVRFLFHACALSVAFLTGVRAWISFRACVRVRSFVGMRA